MPWPLDFQGMSPQYPLDRRLGGPWSKSGSGGEEKKFPTPAWIETPVIQPIA